MNVQSHVPLAPLTTLELGGTAEHFAEARSEAELCALLALARTNAWPVTFLGGGSNSIVADEGVRGLVIALRSHGRVVNAIDDHRVSVTVQAGEPWDAFVAWTVSERLQGLECLSGIPGSVGATPIQNVGAYGQEVADCLLTVRVIDVRTGQIQTLSKSELGFAYRHSALKADPTRFAVSAVEFSLLRDGAPVMAYAELKRAFEGTPAPSLLQVRETVIRLRRSKSMVLDASDANRRSVGSFFTNPILKRDDVAAFFTRAAARGFEATKVPNWPTADGGCKLAAGWLIEQSGIHKGLRRGNVGVSSAHALALVHHGGGSARELLALADEVVASVDAAFGVRLEREPVVLR